MKTNCHFFQNASKQSSVSPAHLSPQTHTAHVEWCGIGHQELKTTASNMKQEQCVILRSMLLVSANQNEGIQRNTHVHTNRHILSDTTVRNKLLLLMLLLCEYVSVTACTNVSVHQVCVCVCVCVCVSVCVCVCVCLCVCMYDSVCVCV